MAQEDNNVIDQPEVLRHKMVTVEIAGKKYEVPEGITIIKALWYSGQEVVRGAGCLGGFCGACAAYYRTKDDPKVQDLSGLPNGGARRHVDHDDAGLPCPEGYLRDTGAQRSEAGPLQSLPRSPAVPKLQRLH